MLTEPEQIEAFEAAKELGDRDVDEITDDVRTWDDGTTDGEANRVLSEAYR